MKPVRFKLPGLDRTAKGYIVGDDKGDVIRVEIISQTPDYNIGSIVLVDKKEIKSKI
jgi:hypothetical protein